MTAQPATQTCGECRIKTPLTKQGIKVAESVASGEVSVIPCPLHAQAEATARERDALLRALGDFWRGVYGSSVAGQLDAKEHGFDPERHSCPHGNTPFYPAHGRWCDDCFTALEEAIAASKGGAG